MDDNKKRSFVEFSGKGSVAQALIPSLLKCSPVALTKEYLNQSIKKKVRKASLYKKNEKGHSIK